MKRSSLLASLVLVSTTSCLAIPQLDLTPRYGQLSLDGDFGAGTGGVTGTASLEQAGLDDDEAFPALRADLKWGGPHLIVSGGQSSWSGSGTVDATIMAEGQTITQGSAVNSDLDLALYQAVVVWDLFPGTLGELGLGFGATLLDFDLSIVDPMTSMEVQSSEAVPVPLLAANVGAQLGGIELAGLISGFTYDANDFDATFVDLDLFARYRIAGGKNHLRGSFVLGWKQVDLDVSYEDGTDRFETDLSLSGPYLGVEFTL